MSAYDREGDFSAPESSLHSLAKRTRAVLLALGAPSIGTPDAPYPEDSNAKAWDRPPSRQMERFFGLFVATVGNTQEVTTIPLAAAGPTYLLEARNLQTHLHPKILDAAGVLGLGSRLRIQYRAPFIAVHEGDTVLGPAVLPEPEYCDFVLLNPTVQVDTRIYHMQLSSRRDELRPDRDVESAATGNRQDFTSGRKEPQRNNIGELPHILTTEARVLRDIVEVLPSLPPEAWVLAWGIDNRGQS